MERGLKHTFFDVRRLTIAGEVCATPPPTLVCWRAAGKVVVMVGPFTLSLEAEASSLGPMRKALRAWLADVGADQIADVVLAVDEAVANAIEHSGLSSHGEITVEAHVVGTILHIEVCDHGVWKEPTRDDTRGRGLIIMNAVMDAVSIEHRVNDTRIVMARQLR
jgi:anti-sigma regulatory factor (Ser/Thr protein kinase)